MSSTSSLSGVSNSSISDSASNFSAGASNSLSKSSNDSTSDSPSVWSGTSDTGTDTGNSSIPSLVSRVSSVIDPSIVSASITVCNSFAISDASSKLSSPTKVSDKTSLNSSVNVISSSSSISDSLIISSNDSIFWSSRNRPCKCSIKLFICSSLIPTNSISLSSSLVDAASIRPHASENKLVLNRSNTSSLVSFNNALCSSLTPEIIVP